MDFQNLITYPKRACFLQKTAKNGQIIFTDCCSEPVGTKNGNREGLRRKRTQSKAKKLPIRQVSGCVSSYTEGSLPGGLDEQKIGRCLSTAPSKPLLVFYVKSRIHHFEQFVNQQ